MKYELADAQKTGLWDSTTRQHIQVTELQTFYIVKNSKYFLPYRQINPRSLYLRFAGQE